MNYNLLETQNTLKIYVIFNAPPLSKALLVFENEKKKELVMYLYYLLTVTLSVFS